MLNAQLWPIEIGLYLSHSWTLSGEQDELRAWFLENSHTHRQRPVHFQDFSLASGDPVHLLASDAKLSNVITEKIALSHVVIVPTGKWSSHNKWLKKEVEAAEALGKPILAIRQSEDRGIGQSIVTKRAKATTVWNSEAAINGVLQLFLRW